MGRVPILENKSEKIDRAGAAFFAFVPGRLTGEQFRRLGRQSVYLRDRIARNKDESAIAFKAGFLPAPHPARGKLRLRTSAA
jgi:hypothetical protein